MAKQPVNTTPAPAPAAAPTPNPTNSTPAATPVPAATPSGLDQFLSSALDGLSNGEPKAPAEPAAPSAKAPSTDPAAPAAPTADPAAPAEPTVPTDILKGMLGDDAAPAGDTLPTGEPRKDILDEPDPLNPSGRQFKALKTELKEERRARKELESKLKDFETKLSNPDATKAQLEKLQKQHDTVLAELERTNLEAHPSFKENILQPIREIEAEFSSLGKQYSLDTEVLRNITAEKDPVARRKAIHEAAQASNLPAYEEVELQNKVAKYVDLSQKREILLANAKTANEQLSQKAKEQELQQRETWQKESIEAFQKAWPEFLKSMPFDLRSETDEKWNAEVDQIQEMAIKLNEMNLSHYDRARLSYQAVALPKVLNRVLLPQLKAFAKENAELKQALAKYQGATPGVGAGAPAGGQAPSTPAGLKEFLDSVLPR